MTVGMKVSLVVIVLFGAVLAFYYGLSAPSAEPLSVTDEPTEALVQVPQAKPINAERDRPRPQPRFDDAHKQSEGVLSESVERALSDPVDRVKDRALAATQQANLLSQTTSPKTPPALLRDYPYTNKVITEVPANDPLAKRNQTASTSGQTISYTIKDDDSLWTIAEDWFGDASRWNLIAKANPLIDPDRLKLGQVIRLPAKDAVRRPIKRSPVRSAGADAYTVKSGDSLARIARIHYGDESKWSVIYEANRAAIGPDPARLKLGTRLRIPPRSS